MERGVIFNFGFLMFDYWRLRKWESENVFPRLRANVGLKLKA